MTNIHPKHSAAPPVYRKPIQAILNDAGEETPESLLAKEERRKLEDSWDAREQSWFFTRPWVCDIKEYNATIINTFLWGMEDMEEVYQSEDFYHGPCKLLFPSCCSSRVRLIVCLLHSYMASTLPPRHIANAFEPRQILQSTPDPRTKLDRNQCWILGSTSDD